MRKCAQCGSTLEEHTLGILGHGGSKWVECPNKCDNVFGLPPKTFD